jgi:nitrite reductase/ring-hydroxylating ferredoxin subunit
VSDDCENQLPDLTRGAPLAAIEGPRIFAGKVGKDRVFACRHGGSVVAYGATCPRLGAPLDQGVVENGSIRCPWRHARFDLATGAATCAPAFDSLLRYPVEVREGLFFVGSARATPSQPRPANMLGADTPFERVPFFWTKHFDLSIRYVGRADNWDELVIDGDPARRDAAVRFRTDGRELAVATVGRDQESLRAELAMEARLESGRGAA